MLIIVSLVFIFIIWLEVPKLLKSKQWRELMVFSILLVLGMGLSFAQVLGMSIPSPNEGIEWIIKTAGGLVRNIV